MEIPGYVIEKIIGKGGMATVYLALHKALNRKVAIKVMNRQQGTDSNYNDRFLREAHIVANLSHPNIITIHDVGEHDGHNYLVMEFLPSGETLKDKIKKGVNSQYALSIVRQVATALKVAHDKNIVHRDVKPDNIMFREDGSVVLMDFGIARSVDTVATQMTQTGLIIGTPQYMSPEQAESENVGAHSDIYSLGVIFYEMLMGKAPYAADTPLALVYQHISAPVPTLGEDRTIYQPLLNRMMAKACEERYSNCDHIIEDIDHIDSGQSVFETKSTSDVDVVDKSNATESENIVAYIESIENSNNTESAESTESTDSVEEKRHGIPVTKLFNKDIAEKSMAAAETMTIVANTNTNIGKGKKKKTRPVRNEKKGKSLLWVMLGSLVVGSVFVFTDVGKLKSLIEFDINIGNLKTLVGLDPGPVYSRVGSLILIPGGSFKMGNSSGDSTENPVHTVKINSFRLGKTEVTQKQWKLVMRNNPSFFKGCDNCPVDSVSWNDVKRFFRKLNKQTGLRYRLPSEAEWEYACRSAGKDEKYCGGSDENKLAWYGGNSGDKAHRVAQKQANAIGLYDMSGNVWEWTQDCWHANYNGAPSYGQAWRRSACTQRVLRGGSWIDVASGLRSTGRMESSASKGNRNIGFRVAQDLE